MKDFSELNVYTKLSEAKYEIKKRWQDKDLRKRVEKFLGNDFPLGMGESPRAVISREIMSPNYEFHFFYDMVTHSGLSPLYLEYLAGKFVAKNQTKYCLCKLYFFEENKNKKYEKIISAKRIVDFNFYEGLCIKDVNTLNGMSLKDFHHAMLTESIPNFDLSSIVEFSDWFNEHRVIGEYYSQYLALFLTHGILFENYLIEGAEVEFTQKRFIPSFQEIIQTFGIKPLIVPMVVIPDENELFWCGYSGKMKEVAQRLLENKKYDI
ncbi:MAG: hypothetical protein IPN70_00780 [Candidatus Moraniibacteriota bacterium]|nr:MAG: hypothetical protein IPN70_00780 [Candidatus Moranbacteria bacterium]